MKRRMKWVVGATGVLLLLVLALGVWQRHAVRMFWGLGAEAMEAGEFAEIGDRTQFLAWMKAHPDAVSLVVASVEDQGLLSVDLEHNGGVPRVLASTMKIIVLGSMARAISEGVESPDTRVPLSEVEIYYLPMSDGGAHEAALAELGLSPGDDAELTIDQLLRAMIRFSDNAATEWAIQRLGPDRIQHAVQDAAMIGQEPLGTLTGNMLAWFNHDTPRVPTPSSVETWTSLRPPERRERAAALNALLSTEWGERERAWRQAGPPLHDIRLQAQLATTFPRGQAIEYARTLGRLRQGFWHSPETSRTIEHYLSWPMENASPDNRLAKLETMGTKGGSLAGVLTEASYYRPNEGPFAGTDRVVVLFMNDINVLSWISLSQSFVHQGLMYELATDPTVVDEVRQILEGA